MLNRRGISLIEIAVAVVIVGILVGVLVPVLTSYANAFDSNVCNDQQAEALHICSAAHEADLSVSMQDLLTEYIYQNELTCPAGGFYVVRADENGAYRVFCTKHGQLTYHFDFDDPKSALPELTNVFDDFSEYIYSQYNFYAVKSITPSCSYISKGTTISRSVVAPNGLISNEIIPIASLLDSFANSSSFSNFSGEYKAVYDTDAHGKSYIVSAVYKSADSGYGFIMYADTGHMYKLHKYIYQNLPNYIRDEETLRMFSQNVGKELMWQQLN